MADTTAATGYRAEDFHPGWLSAHPGIRVALETGEIEGVRFDLVGKGADIEPGDTYLAERNTGVKLLTCLSHDRDDGWINAQERAYNYNTGECVKIALVV